MFGFHKKYSCKNCGKPVVYNIKSVHYIHDDGSFYCDEKLTDDKKPKCHICETEIDIHLGFCSAIGKPKFNAEK